MLFDAVAGENWSCRKGVWANKIGAWTNKVVLELKLEVIYIGNKGGRLNLEGMLIYKIGRMKWLCLKIANSRLEDHALMIILFMKLMRCRGYHANGLMVMCPR